MNEISFSYERMGTKTRFKKEVKGNSEMAWYWISFFVVISSNCNCCFKDHSSNSLGSLWQTWQQTSDAARENGEQKKLHTRPLSFFRSPFFGAAPQLTERLKEAKQWDEFIIVRTWPVNQNFYLKLLTVHDFNLRIQTMMLKTKQAQNHEKFQFMQNRVKEFFADFAMSCYFYWVNGIP